MGYTDPQGGVDYSYGDHLLPSQVNAMRAALDTAVYGDTQMGTGAYLCLSQRSYNNTSGPIQPTESIVRLDGAVTTTVTVELPTSGVPDGAIMFISTPGAGSGSGLYDVVSGSGGATVFQLDATDAGGGAAYFDGSEWRPATFGGGAVVSAGNW